MRDDAPTSSDTRLHRLIFEHSSDPTVVIDDDGRVHLQNRAARELLPTIDVEKLFVWAPQRDADLASFRAQLRVGGRATGEIRVGTGRTARRVALDGRAHGASYVVVLRDVTEQRQMQDELRHLRQLESIGLLTASVVHDFNNVLTAILCSSALLTQAVQPGGDPEEATKLAGDVRTAAERAAALVRRVLSILRREPSPAARTNLTGAVAEMESLVGLVAGRNIEVVTSLDPALADTTVDREQLDQTLLNLTANARDAMPRGGKLTITTANVALDAASAGAEGCPAAGSYVSLTVTDTGEGMAPEVRERIFDRFFTTKDIAHGSGLGLAFALRFVRDSGGCVAVRSARGQGTSVVLYLPQTAPGRTGPVTPPRGSAQQHSRGGDETIVVIEPDDQVRSSVRSALEAKGYRVIDAPTGNLALRQAEMSTSPVRLVLADASTRGADGPAVLERLRLSGHPATMLLVSGATDRAITDLGLDGQPLLRKVFSPDELARRVRAALDAPRSVPRTRVGNG